jgi:hypothetical protein
MCPTASWPPPHDLSDPAIHLDDAKQWDKDEKAFKTVTIPDEIELYLMARKQSTTFWTS